MRVNLYIVVDDVLRLKVTVDDLTFMHIIQCSANLLYNDLGHLFTEFSLLLEEGVQLS